MKAKTNSIQRLFVLVITASLVAFQASAGIAGYSRDLFRPLNSANAAADSGVAASRPVRRAGVSRVAEVYGGLPLSFEANQGQADSEVRFLSRASGYNLYLIAEGAVLEFRPPTSNLSNTTHPSSSRNPQRSAVRMKLLGSNSGARTVALDELPGKSNYFTGNDPKRWRASIPTYAKVKYESVYPGVDVVYYGKQRQLEYDFYVAPRADFKAISVRFDGARRLRVASGGDLVIESSFGEIRQHKPVIYQESERGRREIAGRYRLKNRRDVGFEISAYDKTKPLIIDPILTYATYLGGPASDEANAVAVDSAGNAYVAGVSQGKFPKPGGGFSNRDQGVYIAKLNPAGTHLIYSTMLGIGGATGIAVDSTGSAYVTGFAYSSDDFPTTPNAFARFGKGGTDVFVTKLNPEGNDLIFSTLIGGVSNDVANAIAIDSEGGSYVTGDTFSRDYPTKNALQSNFADPADSSSGEEVAPRLTPAPPRYAFVTRVNPKGSRLTYSTYLGTLNSISQQIGYGIAVDSAGSAYVTGTANGNLVTTPGAFQRVINGGSDAFVVKIAPDGSRMVFSTSLGGSGYDEARGIALDDAGNIYVAGRTQLSNFPTTPGAFQPHNIDSSFFTSTDAGNTWSGVNKGLNAVSVNLLVSSPSPVSTLYAIQIGDSRLYRSTDQGANWNETMPASPFSVFRSLQGLLVVDPSNASTIYAAVGDLFSPAVGITKTTDGGDTWTPINTGLSLGVSLLSLEIDPSNPSVLYLGTGIGLLKSTNGGSNWTGTGLPIGFINSIVIDPKTTSTLYAAAGGSLGVIKSTDGGDSWKATGTLNSPVQRVVIDPKTPSTVYAIVQGAVFKTTDGGATWRALPRVISSFDFYSVNALAIDPFNPTTLYLATSLGVFKSVNGGASWAATGFGANPPNPRSFAFNTNAIVVDRGNSSNIYAGTVAGADGFVTKLNPSGTQLIYSTYLGGVGEDVITSLAVDAAGSAYIAGYTGSASFPTTEDGIVIPPGIDNSRDAVIAKLNAAGSVLAYSTYLGTRNFDTANAIAVDPLRGIYVVGTTTSSEFLTTLGSFQPAKPGQNSGYIVKLSSLRITGASISGKALTVNGEGFDNNAVVVLNGEEQKSKNDGANPASVLIAKKAGKNIAPGQRVVIQVRNPDGTLSNELNFMRPVD